MPPPPAVFSTLTGCPRNCDSRGASTRARRSSSPPAAKATTSVRGCAGQSCAAAPAAAASAANRIKSFLMRPALFGFLILGEAGDFFRGTSNAKWRGGLKRRRDHAHLMLMTALPLAEETDALPDIELVERIRQGDVRAMELLMRRHNRMLFRTARAILRDDAEAGDAVQEAYLRAYKALPDFRGESKVSTWLVRIAANEALTRRRRALRGGEVVPLDAIPDEADPKDGMLRVEMRRILEMRIDALPEAYRIVFMLRALEELSVEETAAALQIPEPTVRTRFFRARGLLRESLARDIDRGLEQAFGFAGERCDRIVRNVMEAIAAGT